MHRKLNKIFSKTKRRRKSFCGFTLTEVIVASALLVTAIVPILKALTGSYICSANVERKTNSLICAQSRLDEIKARSIYSYDDSYAETATAVDGNYLRTVSDVAIAADLRQILVMVGFDVNDDGSLDAGEVLVQLQTLIARRS